MIYFKKAYDSMRRNILIEVLAEFKIQTKVIEKAANKNDDYTTVVRLRCETKKVKVTMGIRQNCSAKTIFKADYVQDLKRVKKNRRKY